MERSLRYNGDMALEQSNLIIKIDSERKTFMTKKIKVLTILVVISVILAGCDALSKATPLPEGDKISDIQGASHISPLKGRPVYNVHGIVTAVRADGFYLQDPNPDDDPATSDGIFVYKAWCRGLRLATKF